MTRNWNCSGAGVPAHTPGEVRLLPTGGGGNMILCRACYDREIRYRKERNVELLSAHHFDLPAWEALKVYRRAK